MPVQGEQIAVDFMDCWRRFDLADALSRIADDAVFQPDLKAAPVKGREAIGELWARYFEMMSSYRFEVRNALSADGLVMLERTEWFGAKDGVVTELPILGVYEIDAAGKITAWRDYWDTSMARSPHA